MAYTTIPEDNEVIANLPGDIRAVTATVTAHTEAESGAHEASAISLNPTGSVSSTDVQAAIKELDTGITKLDTEKAPISHASTTNMFGGASAVNYGHAIASSATPMMNGIAASGTDNGKYAREGHVHPTDTTRASLASPELTGIPSAPTAVHGTNTTQVATTAFVQSAVSSNKTPGITDYISNGREVTAGNGLSVNISNGVDSIAGNTISFDASSLSLSPRMASLIFDKSDGTTGKIDAALPEADANTVALWDFSSWDGSSAIPNSAVGVNGNTIAVSNNLTKAGTVNRIDGYTGYAAQGDGKSGYFTSANYTNIPIGSAEREINILFTCGSVSISRILMYYGSTGGPNGVIIDIGGNNLGVNNMYTQYATGYLVETGKTYLLTACYDGTSLFVYINGELVYKTAATFTTTAGVLNVLNYLNSNWLYGIDTIHFIELRNKMRSPYQIKDIASKLLIPCRYYPDASKPDYTDIRSILPDNAIAIAKVRTSSSAVSEIDKTYGIGRREGAVGGNRRVFLGRQYFSGRQVVSWDNPFATRKVETEIYWAQDTNGSDETLVMSWDTVPNGDTYGVQPYGSKNPSKIKIQTAPNGVCVIEGAVKASGYIGCYAEVIE